MNKVDGEAGEMKFMLTYEITVEHALNLSSFT